MIPFGGSATITLRTTGCQDDAARRVKHLEHVEVHVNLLAARRGDVNLFLFSPHATRSEILRRRPLDNATHIDFTFMTVFNWGEDPRGEWKLLIKDTSQQGAGAGAGAGAFTNHRQSAIQLQSFGMTLYGTATPPHDAHAQTVDWKQDAHKLNTGDLQHELQVEEELSDHLQIRNTQGRRRNTGRTKEAASDESTDKEINRIIDALGEMLREN